MTLADAACQWNLVRLGILVWAHCGTHPRTDDTTPTYESFRLCSRPRVDGLYRRRRPMENRIVRAVRGKGRAMAAAILPLSFATVDGAHLAAVPVTPGPRGPQTTEQAAIERQPICIGSAVRSAGTLSDVLYYRAEARGDGHVSVGYFAFFSEERPWGNNWLTWTVVPALAVDLVYSRALFVGPGVQRAMYGAGDVEGVEVDYDVEADGLLKVDHAVADDRTERPITLTRGEAYALDPDRPTFYSEVWSHQLGGRSVRSRSDLAYVRCYEGDAIRPLPESVGRAFRVEGRAGPAHVERQGGRRLD